MAKLKLFKSVFDAREGGSPFKLVINTDHIVTITQGGSHDSDTRNRYSPRVHLSNDELYDILDMTEDELVKEINNA